jgi:hypothetical protein
MERESSKRRLGVWRSSAHNIPNLTDIMEHKKRLEEEELKKYLLSKIY